MTDPAEYVPNPGWVDRIVRRYADAFVGRVGRELLPREERQGRKVIWPELGCGFYGCVLPTHKEQVVFKVTTDASEAAFVTAALTIGRDNWPDGLVRYYDIVELPERFKRRRVFALWRAEAENVGAFGYAHESRDQKRYEERYAKRDLFELSQNLVGFKWRAQEIRQSMNRAADPRAVLEEVRGYESWAREQHANEQAISTWMKGARRVARLIPDLESIAVEMANTAPGYLVGQAFEFYLERGIVLADVHAGNLGEIKLPDYSTWELVITDPGQMVPIDPKWLEVRVPQLIAEAA